MACIGMEINKFVDVGVERNNIIFFSFNNPTSFSIYNFIYWS